MKPGLYRCDHDWHGQHTIDVTVEAKEMEKSYKLKLINDISRFPDGHIKLLFDGSESIVISKSRSNHGVVNGEDWFVIYPNRNGVPFLFEYCLNQQSYD